VTVGSDIGIGVIGYGAMGKAHAYGYTAARVLKKLVMLPRLMLISGRNEEAVSSAARAYGFESWTTEWREVVGHPGIDIVDICTPPGTHAELGRAAAEAGKAVICEKPLAASLGQAREAVKAVNEHNVLAAIGFNYRRLPALALMKQLVSEGEVGDVLLWRGTWLSDEFLDPAIPFDWRFDRSSGGTTIADLGSHLVDLARWMVGPISRVCAQSATFTQQRGGPGGVSRAVSIDDASSGLLQFSTGARGVLEVARTCARRPCDFSVEINGTKGTVSFDYQRLNELRFGRADEDKRLYGMRTIRAEHPCHPYAADWWAIGQGVGYGSSFVNMLSELLSAWPEGPWSPDLGEGLAVQEVCEALERSVAEARWVDLPLRTVPSAGASGFGSTAREENR